jgi:hypothetical protein
VIKVARAKAVRMDAQSIYKKLSRYGMLLKSERNFEGEMRLATLEGMRWLTVLCKCVGIENILNGFEAGIFVDGFGKVHGIYAARHLFDEEDTYYFTWRYVLAIRPLRWAVIEKEGTLGNLKENRKELWLPGLPLGLVPVYKYLKKRCPFRVLYPFVPLVWPSPPEPPKD